MNNNSAFRFLAAFAVALVAAAAPSTAHAGPQAPFEVSVRLLTDNDTPVSGAVTELSAGPGSDLVSITHSTGQSRFSDFIKASSYRYTVADRVTQAGLALGFVQDVALPGFSDGAGLIKQSLVISRTMPVAYPVDIRGQAGETSNFYTPDGASPHWQIALGPDSKLSMPLWVASLPDSGVLEGYMAYRGAAVPAGKYFRGIAMLVPPAKIPTNDGLVLGINLLGHVPNGDDVVVDVYNIVDGTASLVGFSVSHELYEGGFVYLEVTGRVEGGHLAFLARSNASGPPEVFSVDNNPPLIALAPEGSGSGEFEVGLRVADLLAGVERNRTTEPSVKKKEVEGRELPDGEQASAAAADWSFVPAVNVASSSPSLATDCVPEAPDPPEPLPSCEPDDCTAGLTLGCGGPFIVGGGFPDCQSNIHPLGSPDCFSPGGGGGVELGKSTEHKYHFETTLGGAFSPVSTTGGYTYGGTRSEVTTRMFTAPPGEHMQGQCTTWYERVIACREIWQYTYDRVLIDVETREKVIVPCGGETKTFPCYCTVEPMLTQEVCDRTP